MVDHSNQWVSLIRFSILSTMFVTNLVSLIRLMIFNVKSDKKNDRHCVHTVTNGLVVITNLVYLLTWLPFFGLSIYDSNYLHANAVEQCMLQYLLSSIMTTILLSVLVIRKLYSVFNCENAKVISFALVFAWILPQTLYLVIMEIFGSDKLNPFEQSNKLIIPFNSYFGSELIEFEYNQTSSSKLDDHDFNHASGTFLICVHRLSSQIVSQLSWHYVTIVIPLAATVFLSFIGQALNKSFYSFNDKCINKNCNCKDDLFVSICLGLNLLWLLVLRPLIVLQTLILKQNRTTKQQTYLDFGTHFILVFCVCIFPISRQGGFRTIKSKKSIHNNNRLNKIQLIQKHSDQSFNRSPKISSNLSPSTILALHQQYLMNRNNYLASLNNVNNLNNPNDSNNLDESSAYQAFDDVNAHLNMDNFYRY